MTARTDAERKRGERQRMRDRGYVLRQFWIHPQDWLRVKSYLARINRKRQRAA